MNRAYLAAAALAASLVAAPAFAATESFSASLNGVSEVPAKNVGGTGDMTASLDTATKVLTYTLTYTNLSGPATAAHIHGPAPAGTNAGVLVPFSPIVSPIKGSVTLTDDQIKALEANSTYANIHTAVNPGGEIRGQINRR